MKPSRPTLEAGSETTLTIDDIREHYDTLSPLYLRFWGEHIHHGFWRGDASPTKAQENLIEELAGRADIKEGDRILDVGCGLGGSAMFLARERGAVVKGVSLSPKQVSTAREHARRRGLLGQVHFEVMDAHELDRDPGYYDVVWVVECSEHLFDKAAFVSACARRLAPGGRLAICAWLVNDVLTPAQAENVEAVRVGMLCPSFGTRAEYSNWMDAAGLVVNCAEDITPHVQRTWSLCRPVLDVPLVKTMLAAGSRKLAAFADSFAAIDEAYRTGAMGYGMFVATKV